MKLLDRELLLGRTARELVCIAGGVGVSIFEVLRPGPVDWPNLAVYVVATALFVLRFYAARAAGVAACIGALVQQWPHLRDGEVTWETLGLLPLAGILLLASSDLVARFEGAPSPLRWLPNLWADFSSAQTRTLRWSAYAAGALAGLLDHVTEQLPFGDPTLWPRACMIALVVALALLCAGRALGLLVVAVTSLIAAAYILPLVLPAETTSAALGFPALYSDGDVLPAHLFGARPYLLPAALLAAAAALLTAPSVLRLLRRALRG